MDIALVTVRFEGAETVFPCRFDQTLLDAATSSGLDVPFSCQEGHCGACMVKLASGTVEGRASSGLSRRDRVAGFVLACQSRPSSPEVRISYDG